MTENKTQGWYEFLYKATDNGNVLDKTFFHRERDGLPEVIGSIIERVDNKLKRLRNQAKRKEMIDLIEGWEYLLPEQSHWTMYPEILTDRAIYRTKPELEEEKGLIVTIFQNPLTLKVYRPFSVFGQEFEVDVSEDLKVIMDPNFYSEFLDQLKSADKKERDYHQLVLNPGQTVIVPTEMIDQLRDYNWRSLHEFPVKNKYKERDKILSEIPDIGYTTIK